jgi:predicted DNA-binding protein (MmcQ/YjbR family)
MNIESIRDYCLSLEAVKEDVKWENNLCFCIAEKIFCMVALEGNFGVSFKVRPEDFDILIDRNHIILAPYLARAKWIYIQEPEVLSKDEWLDFIKQSYTLVYSKLSKKLQQKIEQNLK